MLAATQGLLADGGPVLEDGIKDGHPNLGADTADRSQVTKVGDDFLGDVVRLTIDDELAELARTVERQLQNARCLKAPSKSKQDAPLDQVSVIGVPAVSHRSPG